MDFLAAANYWYVPIIAFSLIILIGGLIGFLNGWKTTIFFLAFNLTTLLVVSFTFDPLTSLVQKPLSKYVDIKSSQFVYSIFKAILMLCSLLSINSLAFSTYWIFRKKLKSSMKDNKTNGKSNVISRLIGSSIGCVISLPIALSVYNGTSILAKELKGEKFFNGLTKGVFFGKLDPMTNDEREIVNILLDTKVIDELQNAFEDPSKLTPETKAKIEKVLNSSTGTDLIGSLNFVKDSIERNKTGQQLLDSIKKSSITNSQKLKVGIANRPKIKDLINSLVLKKGESLSASQWTDIQSNLFTS